MTILKNFVTIIIYEFFEIENMILCLTERNGRKMDLTEKTVSSKEIFDGIVVKLRVDTVTLPDGGSATREIIAHPGGVSVLAIDDDKNVFLVKQFRKPTEQALIEIPAGKLEYGEDPLEAGKRELSEETGAEAEEFIPLGYFYPTPAYCEEKTYMYLARGLKMNRQHLDEDEFLEVLKMPYDKLYDMVINDEIVDGKTALAVLKAKRFI